MRWSIVLIIILISGCTPDLPNAVDITPVTAIPTIEPTTLCAIGQDNYEDWAVRIDALEAVHDSNRQCQVDIDLLLYQTYTEFGQFMASGGDSAAAQSAYEAALAYYPDGEYAQQRLSVLLDSQDAETSEAVCEDGTVARLPEYEPTETTFVRFDHNGFWEDETQYPIYGVNYYPRDTPFENFLVETDSDDLATEFELIHDAGLNTLRIFLHYEQLFACDAPVPNIEAFEQLDSLIALASEYQLRLIVVLHEGISADVLYSGEAYLREQTRTIIERYQNEGAILAWDVRDSGDVDIVNTEVDDLTVLRWVAEMALLIREIDNEHPITAGWQSNSLPTAPLVDFVSFQFYGTPSELGQEIANLRASTRRPILLTAVGYSTFNVSDVLQRDLLFQVFQAVEANGLIGWVVFQAFDYPRSVTCTPPDCPSPAMPINQYGIWNTGYFPKLALEAIEIFTGVDE